MLNRGNLCLGKYHDLNIHRAMGLSLCGLSRNEQDYTNWNAKEPNLDTDESPYTRKKPSRKGWPL